MKDNELKNIFPEVPQAFHEAVQQTLNTQICKKTGRRITMNRKFLMVLAAAIAVPCISASAAYVFHWNEKLAKQFGVDEQQQTQLENVGAIADVNQTATENGVTISAVQTLGSPNGVYVLFQVKAPEGIVLPKDESDISLVADVDGEQVNWSAGWMEDDGESAENVSDNERYYELHINNNDNLDLNGKTITACFSDFCGVDGKTGETVKVQGEWKLSWVLSYTEQMEQISLNQSYTVHGLNVTVQSIQLSPLSMTLTLGGDGLEQLIANSDLNQAGGLCAVTLNKQDGTMVNTGSCAESWSDGTYVQNIDFEQVQNPEEIVGFTLTFYHEDRDNVVTVQLP